MSEKNKTPILKTFMFSDVHNNFAMLEPTEMLKNLELEMDYTSRLAWLEELKSMPFEAVWDKYCEECGVPTGYEWINQVKEYEKEVLLNR